MPDRTHLDLFSGIGGFSLAAGWAGYRTVQFVEIDAFCQQVLATHWPEVPCHDDIRSFDGRPYRGAVELLTGGFPCQPYSVAGERRGTGDDRALWPEMRRVIDEARPRWVLAENVPGLIGLGLDGCLADLEALGYEVGTLVVPAAAVGAPHRRDRLWIVAHAGPGDDARLPLAAAGHDANGDDPGRQEEAGRVGQRGEVGVVAHAGSLGRERWPGEQGVGRQPPERGEAGDHAGLRRRAWADADPDQGGRRAGQPDLLPRAGQPDPAGGGPDADAPDGGLRRGPAPRPGGLAAQPRQGHGDNGQAQPGLGERDDGLSPWLDGSWEDGIPRTVSGEPDRAGLRRKQLMALGNAIVPQVAFEIIRHLAEWERNHA